MHTGLWFIHKNTFEWMHFCIETKCDGVPKIHNRVKLNLVLIP